MHDCSTVQSCNAKLEIPVGLHGGVKYVILSLEIWESLFLFFPVQFTKQTDQPGTTAFGKC